jgi:hypothetical protein
LIGVAALCLFGFGVRTLSYEAVLGVLLGAAISAGLSWYFYQQASDDLRKEAERLRHYTDALITYLEAAGAIHPVPRDEAGNPIRTGIIRLSAASLGVSGVAAEITVDEDKPPEGERQAGD